MKNTPPTEAQCFNHRILVIDDNPAIHQDFRKILSPVDSTLQGELDADEASLFGETSVVNRDLTFQIDSAFQGQEGLEMVRAAVARRDALRCGLRRRADAARVGRD